MLPPTLTNHINNVIVIICITRDPSHGHPCIPCIINEFYASNQGLETVLLSALSARPTLQICRLPATTTISFILKMFRGAGLKQFKPALKRCCLQLYSSLLLHWTWPWVMFLTDPPLPLPWMTHILQFCCSYWKGGDIYKWEGSTWD